MVHKFNHQYLQIFFSNVIRDDLNFERLIFQKQSDGSLIMSLHCAYVDKLLDINTYNIVQSLISIFSNYKIFSDLFSDARLIDKMVWRASQPVGYLLPKELQWSPLNNIGFCGDWFDMDCSGGVETAMNSSIRLANIINPY